MIVSIFGKLLYHHHASHRWSKSHARGIDVIIRKA